MLATDKARPKTRPAPSDQPMTYANSAPNTVATAIWTDGAGNGDGANGQEILEREVQADAEHQQDDADLGQLGGESLIGNVTPA